MSIKFSEFIKRNFPKGGMLTGEIPMELARTLSDREEIISEIFNILTAEDNKAIALDGNFGAGKTGLLKSVISLLESSALTYYYECSEVTNLDDILLSLFHYLKKNTPRDLDYARNFRVSASFSLDERVINRIKNLEKPLLLVLDGTENIFRKGRESASKELLTFLHFVQAIPAIRIIIGGKNQIKSNEIKIYPIKLEGLSREKAVNFIKAQSITTSEQDIEDIFKVTGGYPEKILIFSMLSRILGTNAGELIEKMRLSGRGIEKYTDDMVYSLIPAEYMDLTGFFALVRHPFSLDTLRKLNIVPDIEEKTSVLSSLMVLSENNGNFQIKQPLKSHIALRLSTGEKIKIHTYLEELYSKQIISKLEDRILPVSRKILHSEQFFHQTSLSRLLNSEDTDTKASGTREPLQEIFHGFDEDINIKLTEDEKNLIENVSLHEQVGDLHDFKETVINEPVASSEPNLQELSEQELNQMLVDYERQGDRLNYNSVLFSLANLDKEHFRHVQALEHYYSILNASPEHVSDSILFNIYENLGEIYSFRHDFTSAVNWYNKALKVAQDKGNSSQLSEVYFKLALAFDDWEDYDMALKYYLKNVDTSTDAGLNTFLSASLSNIAAIYEERSEQEKAVEYYEKSLEADISANNLEGQYEILSKLGDIYFETGNYPSAAKCFYRELTIAKQINDPYKIAMSYIDIGDIFLFEKNYEKTIRAFILAKKSIENTVSTDSKEKIDRRFRQIIGELGKENYMELIGKIKAKHA